MSKSLTIALFYVISQIATAQELSRSGSSAAPMRSGSYSVAGEDTTRGVKIVSDKITRTYSYIAISGSPKEPLAGLVIVDVQLDARGNLVGSPSVTRGARLNPRFNAKALEMVLKSAPFKVPESYSGGKFMVTFLFEEGGNFKMRIND